MSQPEDPVARILRDIEEINQVLRRDNDPSSEMGRGPEIVPKSPWPPVPEGHDVGYSSEHGPVAVPPPEAPGAGAVEKFLEEKRKRLREELQERVREAETRERDERMTRPTDRDVPQRETPAQEPRGRETPDEHGIVRQPLPYDSPERREAVQAHLARLGVHVDQRHIRELLERGQAKPATEIPKQRAEREEKARTDKAARDAREARERGEGFGREQQ